MERWAREPVLRGATLLDEHRPGWEEGIRLDLLSMESNRFCILGQTFGHYDYGIEDLGIDLKEGGAITFGFDVPRSPEDHPPYRSLTAAWREFLLERRGEGEEDRSEYVGDLYRPGMIGEG